MNGTHQDISKLLDAYLKNAFPLNVEMEYFPLSNWLCFIVSLLIVFLLIRLVFVVCGIYKNRYKFEAKKAIFVAKNNPNCEKNTYDIMVLVLKHIGIYKTVFGKDFLKMMDDIYQDDFKFFSKIGSDWLLAVIDENTKLSKGDMDIICDNCVRFIEKSKIK